MMRRTALLTSLLILAAPLLLPVHAGDGTRAAPAASAAWARATPPGAGAAAVYLTVVGGREDDRLVAASTTVAAMTMLHVVTESDGVSRMRETDGVPVPAGATVRLAPRGTHVMLMNLARPLVAGDHFALELVFERAGRHSVDVSVIAADQAPPAAP